MPTACPAKTVLKLILLRPRQMRPQWVTTMILSWRCVTYVSGRSVPPANLAGRKTTMNDKMPMFPTAQPPRADEDTATIAQVVEQVPGEIELDRIIKAQTSGPQIAKRMVELENSVWSLVRLLLLLPEAIRDKLGATEAIDQARFLLNRSMVLDHNLEPPAGTQKTK
jgi:hypothetical protein